MRVLAGLALITWLAAATPVMAAAKSPDCSGWPINMAFVHLKNAGLTDSSRTDPAKASAVRIASEPIGKGLYRQVYRITFPSSSGPDIVVITSSDSSWQECSMGAVNVFVVSRHLGGK
jgi:hypothetical protein